MAILLTKACDAQIGSGESDEGGRREGGRREREKSEVIMAMSKHFFPLRPC